MSGELASRGLREGAGYETKGPRGERGRGSVELLFWLGSIEFETPRGRFILTGAPEIPRGRRRPATKGEAAQVWSYLEWRLKTASYNELRPLYELPFPAAFA